MKPSPANSSTSDRPDANGADKPPCACRAIDRREFTRLVGIGAGSLATAAAGRPVMAGPFEGNEYLKVIPADKRLDAQWVRSLYERGEKETYSDPEALKHIGMPVGGLFAGTLYLSGDGRLWLWDIFNRDQTGIEPRAPKMPAGFHGSHITGGLNYVNPAPFIQPLKQGFSLALASASAVGNKTRTLDLDSFSHVTFDGRYPIGRVTYRDDDCPVEIELEAFSPFVPLNVDDSSLPATVMSYRVKNRGDEPVEFELHGHLQNPVCLETAAQVSGRLRNRAISEPGLRGVECLAEAAAPQGEPRPDVSFENFEKPTYDGWTTEGTAFGEAPVLINDVPDYQGDVNGQGRRVVNSHASAPGDDVAEKDGHTGTLTSKPFTIERRFIQFLIGGGSHQGKTCVNVLVDGKVVASATGRNHNRMQRTALDVGKYQGQQAQLQVVDNFGEGWGNIGIDDIVFTDRPLTPGSIQQQRDFGTMTLVLLGGTDKDIVKPAAESDPAATSATAELQDELTGTVGRRIELPPGSETTVTFAITWHFPNFYSRGCGGRNVGHHYASRFDSALEVARYLAANYERLAGQTRQWVETWYDSTLPYWLLDRTMANTSTLATTTCYRFEDGRFWAWEGIGCCAGTCTHVWHYAQAPGRLFPEVERIERERVNFGIGLHADGGVGMRTNLERANHAADDGQCGRILGVYREHQMSPDDQFLRRLWPQVKRAIQYMIHKDGNADGMVEGSQPNTLDAAWFGKISFLASLYLAALKAGQAMATEMGDAEFATQCRTIAERGAQSILECYNGEYFMQLEDPAHQDKIGVGPGCYIDQVFGQTWAHWVGLGQLFDRDKQLSALRALWKYSFVPDVGPFREAFPRGRWYAMAGDAGLLMCTWPKGGQNPNFKKHWQYMYFNECMSGFEWQAAAHMIWEGHDQPDLLKYGLAISRAIHDRYNAALRNPYNEIECSDHYARAMASYGAFQAVCGLNCHGPKGHLEFAPRLSPDNFRAAFTSAEGWGTIEQQRDDTSQTNTITVKFGQLRLISMTVDVGDRRVTSAVCTTGDRETGLEFDSRQGPVHLKFDGPITLRMGERAEVRLKCQ